MSWVRSTDTSMRKAPWTVARVQHRGELIYELWNDAIQLPVGRFMSFEKAREAAEKLEREEARK